MKRKIITSLAAAAIAACTITTASATEAPKPLDRFCFYWQCPSYEEQFPEQTPPAPEISLPENSGAMTQLERAACDLINTQRKAHGLAPLTIDANLSIKARIKSEDMKVNRYFSHNSPTYGTPFNMMKQLGITYRSAGENIAMGYTTAQAVVNAWMASATHRANILSTNYTSMGIGYVDGYWTQWFLG